jgi:hypothetical protein
MIPPNVLEGKPLGIVVDHADAPTTAPALGESWGLSFGEDMTPGEGGAITGVVTTIHLEADRSHDQRSPSRLKLAVRSHGLRGTG